MTHDWLERHGWPTPFFDGGYGETAEIDLYVVADVQPQAAGPMTWASYDAPYLHAGLDHVASFAVIDSAMDRDRVESCVARRIHSGRAPRLGPRGSRRMATSDERLRGLADHRALRVQRRAGGTAPARKLAHLDRSRRRHGSRRRTLSRDALRAHRWTDRRFHSRPLERSRPEHLGRGAIARRARSLAGRVHGDGDRPRSARTDPRDDGGHALLRGPTRASGARVVERPAHLTGGRRGADLGAHALRRAPPPVRAARARARAVRFGVRTGRYIFGGSAEHASDLAAGRARSGLGAQRGPVRRRRLRARPGCALRCDRPTREATSRSS